MTKLRAIFAAGRMPINQRRKQRRQVIVAHELTDREYLGIIRGEIVWNPHTDQWEKRDFDESLPWWKLGIADSEHHQDSPVALPKQPPAPHDSLPSHETQGGLTHDQLIRIHQLNDLVKREVITADARDDEVSGITSESR
jgi:hypothetical protein